VRERGLYVATLKAVKTVFQIWRLQAKQNLRDFILGARTSSSAMSEANQILRDWRGVCGRGRPRSQYEVGP